MQLNECPQGCRRGYHAYISFNKPIDKGSIIKRCTLKLLQVPILATGLKYFHPQIDIDAILALHDIKL